MGIFQRGTAAVTTGGAYGPADRWFSNSNGNTFSTSQGSFVSGDTLYDTGGAQYFTTIAVTSVANAANYSLFAQKIEDVRLLAGQTVTVSFWAKAASGTPSIGLSLDQGFGTGGSPSADATGTGQAQAITTTWTKYSKTFSVPSLNGKTIGTTANTSITNLVFWLDAGSTFNTRSGSIGQASKTVSIAQVQLEVGSVSTLFEFRPIQIETALCQRYLPAYIVQTTTGSAAIATGQAYTGTNAIFTYPFSVQPRTVPSGISVSSGAHFVVTNSAAGVIATSAVAWNGGTLVAAELLTTVAAGLTAGNASMLRAGNASAQILFTGCEL